MPSVNQDTAVFNEELLIEQSKADPEKFKAIYLKYYRQILGFVYKRMEEKEDAYEVTSVVFAKALHNLKKFESRGCPFSSWLYRIAVNESVQFYREQKKNRVVSIDFRTAKNIVDESRGAGEAKELEGSLRMALQYLDEEEMQLIELRYFEERPFAEVGEILNITENNAKVKTYRIIDKLREIFKKINHG